SLARKAERSGPERAPLRVQIFRRAVRCRCAGIAPPQRRNGSPALARTAIEAHNRTPIVDDARLGLPCVSVDDLEACLQAPVAAKVLQGRQHPLPSAPPGETPPAVDA